VPHPSSFKQDFRVLKGQNAMHPALARCLVQHLDPQPWDVVLDPLCGSGSVLLEAWLQLQGQCHLLGGDMSVEECCCCAANLMDGRALVDGLCVHGVVAPAAGVLQGAAVHAVKGEDAATDADGSGADGCGAAAAVQQVLRYMADPARCPLMPVNRQELQELSAAARGQQLQGPKGASADGCERAQPVAHGGAGGLCLAAGVVRWNAGKLPLRDGSVDCIASDLPFGRRCGNHRTNSNLYPALLSEFARVLRPAKTTRGLDGLLSDERGGACDTTGCRPCCVLLTIERRVMLEALASQNVFQLLRPAVCVDMGGLCPYVFVLGHATRV
jgi:hypothetical protein